MSISRRLWLFGDETTPSFIAPGGEAYKRDVPDAEIHLLDAGHFALNEKKTKLLGLISHSWPTLHLKSIKGRITWLRLGLTAFSSAKRLSEMATKWRISISSWGRGGSAAETAFCTTLTNQKAGDNALLALIRPNLMTKPATVMFNKVDIKNGDQAGKMFGPAQQGIGKAVIDSVNRESSRGMSAS